MARKFGAVSVSIWTDPDFLALPDNAQRLYMLLVTQRKLSTVGLISYMPARWARLAPNTTTADIEAVTEVLEQAGFVVVDRDTDELLVRTLVSHDERSLLANSNLVKGMWNAWEAIESRMLRQVSVDNIPEGFWEFDRAEPPTEAVEMHENPVRTEVETGVRTSVITPVQTKDGTPVPTQVPPPDAASAQNPRSEPTGTQDGTPVSTEDQTGVRTHAGAPTTETNTQNVETSSQQATAVATRPDPTGQADPTHPAARNDEDQSPARLTKDERRDRVAAAVEVLVARGMERSPTTRSSPEAHAATLRKRKTDELGPTAHKLLHENPALTAEALADLLEPGSNPAATAQTKPVSGETPAAAEWVNAERAQRIALGERCEDCDGTGWLPGDAGEMPCRTCDRTGLDPTAPATEPELGPVSPDWESMRAQIRPPSADPANN